MRIGSAITRLLRRRWAPARRRAAPRRSPPDRRAATRTSATTPSLGRVHRVLHLHRLEHDQHVWPAGDGVADLDAHIDHLAGHAGHEAAPPMSSAARDHEARLDREVDVAARACTRMRSPSARDHAASLRRPSISTSMPPGSQAWTRASSRSPPPSPHRAGTRRRAASGSRRGSSSPPASSDDALTRQARVAPARRAASPSTGAFARFSPWIHSAAAMRRSTLALVGSAARAGAAAYAFDEVGRGVAGEERVVAQRGRPGSRGW